MEVWGHGPWGEGARTLSRPPAGEGRVDYGSSRVGASPHNPQSWRPTGSVQDSSEDSSHVLTHAVLSILQCPRHVGVFVIRAPTWPPSPSNPTRGPAIGLGLHLWGQRPGMFLFQARGWEGRCREDRPGPHEDSLAMGPFFTRGQGLSAVTNPERAPQGSLMTL